MTKTEAIINSLYGIVPKGISLSLPFILKSDGARKIAIFTYFSEYNDGDRIFTGLSDGYIVDCSTLEVTVYSLLDEELDDFALTERSDADMTEDTCELEERLYELIDGYIDGIDPDPDEYKRLVTSLEYLGLTDIYKSLGADIL